MLPFWNIHFAEGKGAVGLGSGVGGGGRVGEGGLTPGGKSWILFHKFQSWLPFRGGGTSQWRVCTE